MEFDVSERSGPPCAPDCSTLWQVKWEEPKEFKKKVLVAIIWLCVRVALRLSGENGDFTSVSGVLSTKTRTGLSVAVPPTHRRVLQVNLSSRKGRGGGQWAPSHCRRLRLQQQTPEQALLGAGLLDLDGSAPTCRTVVMLEENRKVRDVATSCRAGGDQTHHLPVEAAHDVSGEGEEGLGGACKTHL